MDSFCMCQILQWCERLGVKIVTVFAFSTDNFKRPQEEVDSLMRMAKEKVQRVLSTQ